MATIDEQKRIVAKLQSDFRGQQVVSLLKAQSRFPRAAPVRGPVSICQDTVHVADETAVRDTLFECIRASQTAPLVIPSSQDVAPADLDVEWVGPRKGWTKGQDQDPLETADQVFDRIQEDCGNDAIVIFCHGGAFYAGNSVLARPATAKLARLTKSRILSVDYRLAPQNQFPSHILDLLLVYLEVLYPGAQARHGPVQPQSIVIAGESSGGGLCMGLAQFILALRRLQGTSTPKLRFHGHDVVVPMPAGFALVSPEIDRALCLPSWTGNVNTDILQNRSPVHSPECPPDAAWPTNPPRHDVYCDKSAWMHPFANPLVAEDWTGCAPLWLCFGQEQLIDCGRYVASVATKQRVPVVFHEYEGMPHIFPIMLGKLPQAQDAMKKWAEACLAMTSGEGIRKSYASRIRMPGDRSEELDMCSLVAFNRDEMLGMVKDIVNRTEPFIGRARARV